MQNGLSARAAGSSARWISAATLSSCSYFALSSACRYRRAFSMASAASADSVSSAEREAADPSAARSRLSRYSTPIVSSSGLSSARST